ncbi:hypothetical protein EV210_101179 [Anaerospora hongkongensis]|uniref:Uncharacterized protein n=1 Tax=Anaerospora hongkongensis TaxID=244830 RepID=A0A4R1Q1Y0_9FIRM|nr:hypothetical protein [Anaerospora hongkongensis]TCL39979.1 hypothetical protein EV210_101179 [Anaerospora hongkongensis]
MRNEILGACGIGNSGPISTKVATVESFLNQLRDRVIRNRQLSRDLMDSVARPEPIKCQAANCDTTQCNTLEENLRELINDVEASNIRLEEVCSIIESQLGNLKLV